MRYTYPDYYKEFQCIADKCEDTCCAGWQIMIDEASLEHYKTTSHPFKEKLAKSIDWEIGAFQQDGCRRCAFLNDKNLCELYIAMGEDSLCHTCTNYPRHIEEFENVREYTLSLSCPEVARLIMGRNEKVTFYSEEDEEFEEFEDFDMLLHGILQDTREVMLAIVQDRALAIDVRMAMIWNMAKEMQEALDAGMIFQWEAVAADRNFAFENKFDVSLKLFQGLYRLELLNEDWGNLLDETAMLVYGQGKEYCNQVVEDFGQWLEVHMPQWRVQLEQLLVYFLSTYLCGAVYDGYVATKVQVAVVSGLYIYVILCGMWMKNQQMLTFEEVVDVVYRYSRELEHSDINMEELENYMEECI